VLLRYTFRVPARPTAPAITAETFRFFRELVRNNHKPWMDANRDRYKSVIVEPFRVLLDRLAPAARKLNPRFETSGRVGVNFSRINRDIRFARDKSPYRPQMYLFFAEPSDDEGAQLYIGVSPDAATAGFRIYGSGRTSPLVRFARPRASENAKWIERVRRRLRNYESYWYSAVKGEWTKRKGWPAKPEEWKKLRAWIVRRKFSPAIATRAAFEHDAAKIFRDVYPLYEFTMSPSWKP
jgi:uncharacterized protein (TIGR02453 family)